MYFVFNKKPVWTQADLTVTQEVLHNPYCGWYQIYGYTLTDESQTAGQESYIPESVADNQPTFWKSRNWLNPFETYIYSPDAGISIRKGIIRRTYITIPTTTTKARIHQGILQRLLGFSDVSFQNNYTGQQFGEDTLQNIRFKSARELMYML